jgi:hypothetical protein
MIKALEPHIRPTGTQAASIRKALDNALTEAIMSLPLEEATRLPPSTRGDLEVALGTLDQKLAEKLATSWEPKRKLDAEGKRAAKVALVELLRGQRTPYEPLPTSLADARAGDVRRYRTTIERAAPEKDLKSLLTKWDKHFKPVPTNRAGLAERLVGLLGGTPPAERLKQAKRR